MALVLFFPVSFSIETGNARLPSLGTGCGQRSIGQYRDDGRFLHIRGTCTFEWQRSPMAKRKEGRIQGQGKRSVIRCDIMGRHAPTCSRFRLGDTPTGASVYGAGVDGWRVAGARPSDGQEKKVVFSLRTPVKRSREAAALFFFPVRSVGHLGAESSPRQYSTGSLCATAEKRFVTPTLPFSVSARTFLFRFQSVCFFAVIPSRAPCFEPFDILFALSSVVFRSPSPAAGRSRVEGCLACCLADRILPFSSPLASRKRRAQV